MFFLCISLAFFYIFYHLPSEVQIFSINPNQDKPSDQLLFLDIFFLLTLPPSLQSNWNLLADECLFVFFLSSTAPPLAFMAKVGDNKTHTVIRERITQSSSDL